MNTQLPLGITWRDQATFTNFYTGDNTQLVDSLGAEDEALIYLWGETGKKPCSTYSTGCVIPVNE